MEKNKTNSRKIVFQKTSSILNQKSKNKLTSLLPRLEVVLPKVHHR